jgi:hypothetical protein
VCDYPFDCPPGVLGTSDTVRGSNASVRSTGSTSGSPSTLPFTGGEITLITLAGGAAMAGGVVLVAAGRKRRPTA